MPEWLSQDNLLFFLIVFAIAGFLLFITRVLIKKPFPYLFTIVAGLTIGLLVGALVGNSFSGLPDPFGKYLPPIIMIFVAVGILDLLLAQMVPLSKLIDHWFGGILESVDTKGKYVLDSSALIDGRLIQLSNLPLLHTHYIAPRFVVEELQELADSKDLTKRRRGRVGLDNLKELQNKTGVKVAIEGFSNNEPVDKELVKYCKEEKAILVTFDSNLAKVAEIDGITVLNLNQVINALKSKVTPGERFSLYMIHKGKGKQAIGYLPDGTMVAVDDAESFLNKEVMVEVSKIHQTVNGQIVFATVLDKVS